MVTKYNSPGAFGNHKWTKSMRTTNPLPMTNLIELYQYVTQQLTGHTSPLTHLEVMMNHTSDSCGLKGWRILSDYPAICSPHYQEYSLSHSVLPLSLMMHDQFLGLVEWQFDGVEIPAETRILLESITQCCATILHDGISYARAMLDTHTHTLSRRFLEEYMIHEQRQMFGRSVVVASIDVDNLKWVNDTQGHQQGDALLKTVGEAISRCCRLKDFAIHLSGDEFALILRDIHEVKLKLVQQCLKARLHEVLTRIAPVRFSFGITAGHRKALQALLDTADASMYQHKKRNKQHRIIRHLPRCG